MKLITSSFYENFKMAIDTIRGNKLRAFLTIVGVLVGVITVMLISSIISGINVAVEKQVEQFGTRSIFLYKMDIGIRTSMPTREERMRKPLTVADAEAIGRLSSIEVAVPSLDISNNFFGGRLTVSGKNGKTSNSVQLTGTTSDVDKTPGDVLVDGRWFSNAESEAKENVCVIGDSVRDAYFPYSSPLGQTLEIGGNE